MQVRLSIAVSLLSASAFAQAPPPRLEFEVVSVKLAGDMAGVTNVHIGFHIDGAQVHLSYASIKDTIRIAYKVKNYQVTGPDYLESQRFDIDAKLPAGSTKEQVPEMLQNLLADRFQLKFHNESKEFPVYALEVAPGGTKLKDLTEPGEVVDAKAPSEAIANGGPGGVSVAFPGGGSYQFGDNKFVAKKLTMPYLVDTLSRFMDRPVIDMTDLKGKYDFSIQLTEEDYRSMLIRSAITAGVSLPPEALHLLDGASEASLFAGIKALGLKLDARKAPLPMMVVDHVLKTPSDN